MTRDETIKILAILKAAYPNSYKNMTRDEANGTVMVWATQFADFPADVVLIAVNKLISTSTFPPAICEVKKKIQSLYWEVWEILDNHSRYKTLTDEEVKSYQRILDVVSQFRTQQVIEPTLKELFGSGKRYLIGSGGE